MKWPGLLVCLLLPIASLGQNASHGAAACVPCHSQAKTQPGTSMAHALEPLEEGRILLEHPILTANIGKYSYRIERKGNESTYSVTDGVSRVTMPIRWALGASSGIGQTYILEKDGELYESRVSYFRELKGLDLTLGYQGTTPADLTEAAGRLLSQDEKLRCFGCHATNAVEGKKLTLDKLGPGVECSHCHQGIELHLAAAQLNSYELEVPKELSKLRGMSADEAAHFCGQCHRTWEEIAVQKNPSIANIRFQPYRLTGSKCYDPDDKRISCLACHDPHQEVSTKITDYDAKCLACHAGGKPGAKPCPVSKDQCATCHMPKLELPGAHFKFSDHRIRIVKPKESYPG